MAAGAGFLAAASFNLIAGHWLSAAIVAVNAVLMARFLRRICTYELHEHRSLLEPCSVCGALPTVPCGR